MRVSAKTICAVLAVLAFAVWIAKECLADIPQAGDAALVMLDSVVDLTAGGIGYALGAGHISGLLGTGTAAISHFFRRAVQRKKGDTNRA